MSPSGVMTMRCGLGASASLGGWGLATTGEGEGNVATSAILCSIFTSGSSGSGEIGGATGAGATAGENCAIEVLVSPRDSQSCGGMAIAHTFAGFSNSTPTRCNLRDLCDMWTDFTLARTAGGFGSTFRPTTCSVTQAPTP